MEHSDSGQSLGATARWTASVRASESARADRLFDDPWALALAGKEGADWIAQRTPESVIPMIIRTRFFDDFLRRLASEFGLSQIVLLAAGLDTRAFRLNWRAGTRLYELDQAAVLQYKDRVLAEAGARPTCARQTIPGDLTDPWGDALIQNGFDPQQPSAWLLEGFLFYLANEHITRLLDQVTRLAAAQSWIGFDTINGEVLTSPYTKRWIEMQAHAGAPWIGTMDDPEALLAARGWQATLTQAGASDANYGRWVLPVYPVKMPKMPHNWYVTAQKPM